MIKRRYDLEVIAKYEGTHGYGSITLQPPKVDGFTPFDTYRPIWVESANMGGPLNLHLTPEEMAEVEVGTLLHVTINGPAT